MPAKFIHQFIKGDIVHFYGARFEVLENARESQSHRPSVWPIGIQHGPCDCAVALARCIDGQETPGYIGHGKEWTFQGNLRAGTFHVE